MSYAISLPTEAQHHLAKLPLAVRRFIVRQLRALGEYPTLLSKPSYFPYRAKCQLFQIGCLYEEQRWELCALFQYGQDEQTIFILGILFSKVPPDAEAEGDFPLVI